MSDDVNCVSEGFEKALGTLEFDKILDMLCDCAPIEGAKTLAKRFVRRSRQRSSKRA